MSLVVCPFAAISERVGSSESGGTHIHCNARMNQYGESDGVLIHCNARMSERWWVGWYVHSLQCANKSMR